MEAFFPELLDGFPDSLFLEKLCEKFHYDKTRLPELQTVAGEMLPLMRREGCWEARAPWISGVGEKPGAAYEGVAITLGKALDGLQERYHEEGRLTESYMLEALASELLLAGYRAYNSRVMAAGEWHVARYHFPGSEESLPLELLPQMLCRFSLPLSCNEAFCIQPKKSVVFVAELTCEKGVYCEGICVGCRSAHCPNRIEENIPAGQMPADMPLTYGYRRIFGKW